MSEIVIEKNRNEIFRDLRKEFLKIDVPDAEAIGRHGFTDIGVLMLTLRHGGPTFWGVSAAVSPGLLVAQCDLSRSDRRDAVLHATLY